MVESTSVSIFSLNVGKPKVMVTDGEELFTGFDKNSVEGPLHLTKTNFTGDGQADLVHHGGEDKAVCVYPYEHYSYWEKELQTALMAAAFGENLTVVGLTEDKVHIGDIFQLGTSLVQISQPRQPCYKLAKRYQRKDLPLLVQNTGYTGYYFRVLEEGRVEKKSRLSLVESDPNRITVAFANIIMHHDKNNLEAIEEILKVKALSKSWTKTFENRINGIEVDNRKRLEGK